MDSEPLADDLLHGAEQIARFTGLPTRRVYYLAERGSIPVFRLGAILTARKSELVEVLSAKSRAA